MTLPALSPNARLRWDAVERQLRSVPSGSKILELGAGSGATAARLARIGAYVGVEPDPSSAATARTRLPVGARLFASIDEVADRDFDLVCSFEVLEHVHDDLVELRTWLDHARPGAGVIVSVPAHRHRFAAADEGVGHLRRYDPADLVTLLERSGLVDIEVRAYGFPLGYALEWMRNRLAERDLRRGIAATDAAARTAASGRLRQPSPGKGLAIDAATLPFRLLQRLSPSRTLGPGLIGYGRVPPP